MKHSKLQQEQKISIGVTEKKIQQKIKHTNRAIFTHPFQSHTLPSSKKSEYDVICMLKIRSCLT